MLILSIICACLVAALVVQSVLHHRERREADAERRLLILHIQSPEIAVAESIERPKREPVPVVGVDDDEAFVKAREKRLNA